MGRGAAPDRFDWRLTALALAVGWITEPPAAESYPTPAREPRRRLGVEPVGGTMPRPRATASLISIAALARQTGLA